MPTTFTATRQFSQTIRRQTLNTNRFVAGSFALARLYHAKMIAQKYNTPLSISSGSDYIYIQIVVTAPKGQSATVSATVMNKTSSKTVVFKSNSSIQVDIIISLPLSDITSDNQITITTTAGSIRSVIASMNFQCQLTPQIPSQGDIIRASDINLLLEWISLSNSQNISAGSTISALHVKDQNDVTVHIGVQGSLIYADDIAFIWQQYRDING